MDMSMIGWMNVVFKLWQLLEWVKVVTNGNLWNGSSVAPKVEINKTLLITIFTSVLLNISTSSEPILRGSLGAFHYSSMIFPPGQVPARTCISFFVLPGSISLAQDPTNEQVGQGLLDGNDFLTAVGENDGMIPPC
jgi:hypothetical protein